MPRSSLWRRRRAEPWGDPGQAQASSLAGSLCWAHRLALPTHSLQVPEPQDLAQGLPQGPEESGGGVRKPSQPLGGDFASIRCVDHHANAWDKEGARQGRGQSRRSQGCPGAWPGAALKRDPKLPPFPRSLFLPDSAGGHAASGCVLCSSWDCHRRRRRKGRANSLSLIGQGATGGGGRGRPASQHASDPGCLEGCPGCSCHDTSL